MPPSSARSSAPGFPRLESAQFCSTTSTWSEPTPATTATCPAGEPGVAPKMTRSPNCGATAPPLGSCCHGVLSLGPTSHIWYAYATGQIGGAPKRSDAQRCASSTHSYRRP